MPLRFPVSSSGFRKPRPRRRRHSAASGSGAVRMARRPALPRFWRNIAPSLRALSPVTTSDRPRLWLLVLQAKGIPFRFFGKSPLPALYVPPVAAHAAIHEITAVEREKPFPPLPAPPRRAGAYWFAALILLLVPWHHLRWSHATILPFLPAPGTDWLTLAGLDAYKVTANHEWWRAVTALTLHADAAHLTANLVMGCLFGIPLCRYTGVGVGLLLTLVAGTLGNVATALLRPASAMSQGFSTAVFAAVGLLAAFAAVPAARHALMYSFGQRPTAKAVKDAFAAGLPPLAAGLGLLALLGGSNAPGVDYLAHCMGLFAGILTGLAVALAAPTLTDLHGKPYTQLQLAAATLAAALLLTSWRVALG